METSTGRSVVALAQGKHGVLAPFATVLAGQAATIRPADPSLLRRGQEKLALKLGASPETAL